MKNQQSAHLQGDLFSSRPLAAFLPYLDWVVIAIVSVLVLLRVPEPFWKDQVPFMMFAEQFSKGALLYRDMWDIKPPGIYGVYLTAGKLFGFTGLGMHFFDGLWMMALGIVLRLSLAQYFTRSWIAKLVPWLSVGVYLTILDPNDQMQVESLVGLPMYALIWCTWKATQAPQTPKNRCRWMFLSGIAGGIVLLFKLIFLPLIFGLWMVYLLHCLLKQRQPFVPAIVQSVPPVLLGILMPLTPVMVYWASHNVLPDVYQTLITYPVQMVKNLPKRSFMTLISTIFSCMRRITPVSILAVVAIVHMVRSKRFDFLMTQMIVWVGLGLLTISIQTQSWWRYHFFLLLVPVAILAAKGIDLALRPESRFRIWQTRLVAGCLVGLVGLNLWTVVDISSAMARSGLPLTPETQLAYQQETSINYTEAWEEVQFVNEPGRKPGPMFVIGDPTFYILANRTQAIPLLGTIAEILLPEQWTLMERQLEKARPHYIYIENVNVQFIPPTFLNFMNRDYQVAKTSAVGVWYEKK